jgi:hypothetical protein
MIKNEDPVQGENAPPFDPDVHDTRAFFAYLDTTLRSDRFLHWSAQMEQWGCQDEIVSSFQSDCSEDGARSQQLLDLSRALVSWADGLTAWAKSLEDCYASKCTPPMMTMMNHVPPPESPFSPVSRFNKYS